MAAERIKAAITETLVGDNPVKAILDAYNPTGSTAFVNFTTSKPTRRQTDPRRCHVNWVVCDSDWEAEFCRVAEAHRRPSRRHRRLVQPQGPGLAALDHAVGGLLRRGPGGGARATRQARNLQYGPGQPVHLDRLHQSAEDRRDRDQYGRQAVL
jgi:hypothetical protein